MYAYYSQWGDLDESDNLNDCFEDDDSDYSVDRPETDDCSESDMMDDLGLSWRDFL